MEQAPQLQDQQDLHQERQGQVMWEDENDAERAKRFFRQRDAERAEIRRQAEIAMFERMWAKPFDATMEYALGPMYNRYQYFNHVNMHKEADLIDRAIMAEVENPPVPERSPYGCTHWGQIRGLTCIYCGLWLSNEEDGA